MGILVEMGWGGLVQAPDTITWTDITDYVDQSSSRAVTITRGASDELSDTQPGTAVLHLDNQDGHLTPGNSASLFSPFVRRNAPIRISVTTFEEPSGSAPWPLAQLGDDFNDNQASATLWPSNYGGATEVGGKARIPLTPGTPAGYKSARDWDLEDSKFTIKFASLPAVGGSSAAEVTVMANSTTNGTRVGWVYDVDAGTLRAENQVGGTDGSPTILTFAPIAHLWLRIRETAGTLYWETAGDGYNWTVRRSMATPAWIESQSVIVELAGSRTGGTGDYVEFDLAGATVWPRLYGTVNEFPVSWDGLASTVTISATDLFKRLGRMPPLRSCLAEEIVLDEPIAYYPLTEPSDSTSAGDLSGITAGPLAITQVLTGGTIEFASADAPPATGDQIPLFTPVAASQGKYLTADLGATFESRSSTEWHHFECWFRTSTVSRVIFALTSTDRDFQLIFALDGSGVLQLECTQDGNPVTVVGTTSGNVANGALHHLVYDEQAQDIWLDGALSTVGAVDFMFRLRQLSVGGYDNGRLWNGSIGHLAIYTTPSAMLGTALAEHYTAGTTAFSGETADDRIQRLVRYAGLDGATIYGSTHDPVAGQGPGGQSALARMREVEQTEAAKLFAARDWYGIDYTSRDLRYNPSPGAEAFTIEYADLETSEVQLKDDDQKLINKVDAARPGGATQRVVADSSILAFGPYEPSGGGSVSFLKTTDNAVLDAASWMVFRYADPDPELREVPIEAYSHPEYLSILGADMGNYFSVTDLPSQAPASSMRVTVEGYTETIQNNRHKITFHTSRSATDSVWVLDDATYSALGATTRLAY
ncbi:hypothetical protein [Streptomyces lunaelactis]|uniref:hypothetical protein n=1 Tax=Streptomyces lunaelactis TaxID=1535768 RepID=UPI001585B1BD|nr:hypothetical protein [Streptomyces lunaelactis]NUL09063.1 hypothetical protein [Streptomyces lunaelactis]